MAKPMPRAGRPHRTPGNRPAPVQRGVTQGSARDRAQLDVPWNPLGSTNGPEGGTGSPAPKKPAAGTASRKPQGGIGS